MYELTYLYWSLIFLTAWLFLFIWKKSYRKEMIVMSIIFAFLGPLVDLAYSIDWWNAQTITNTRIGMEAIIFGFGFGGITAVIYEVIFRKHLRIQKKGNTKERKNLRMFLVTLGLLIGYFGGFFILKLNSLLSTILATIICLTIIYIKRPDLIKNSIISGILILILGISINNILELLTPGWIEALYLFNNTPKIIILNMSIDDIIWFLCAGLVIGPLYEYWQEGRLVNLLHIPTKKPN